MVPLLRASLTRKIITKYYYFHWDHRHDIESYYALKEQIEDLVQKGHLNKFLRWL